VVCADAIAGEMGSMEEELLPLQQFWAKILARTRSQLGDDFDAELRVRIPIRGPSWKHTRTPPLGSMSA